MYLALKRAGIPAELHLYSKGGHGFGVRQGQPDLVRHFLGRAAAVEDEAAGDRARAGDVLAAVELAGRALRGTAGHYFEPGNLLGIPMPFPANQAGDAVASAIQIQWGAPDGLSSGGGGWAMDLMEIWITIWAPGNGKKFSDWPNPKG